MKKNNERDQKIKSKKEPFIVKGNPRQAGIGEDPATIQLIDTVKKSSEATNKLTEKIKFLTWILVILSIVMIGITVFSLYMQFFLIKNMEANEDMLRKGSGQTRKSNQARILA